MANSGPKCKITSVIYPTSIPANGVRYVKSKTVSLRADERHSHIVVSKFDLVWFMPL